MYISTMPRICYNEFINLDRFWPSAIIKVIFYKTERLIEVKGLVSQVKLI